MPHIPLTLLIVPHIPLTCSSEHILKDTLDSTFISHVISISNSFHSENLFLIKLIIAIIIIVTGVVVMVNDVVLNESICIPHYERGGPLTFHTPSPVSHSQFSWNSFFPPLLFSWFFPWSIVTTGCS